MSENKKVVVLGHDGYLSPYRQYLISKGFKSSIAVGYNASVEETLNLIKQTPDLVLFTGGQDINPQTYGEKYKGIYFNDMRDKWEAAWFDYCLKNKIPMLGTCRGMQQFTIQTGGKLLKHVNNHTQDHHVFTPSQDFVVNSLHHQMCLPWPGTYQLLAWAHRQAQTFEPGHYINRLPMYGKMPVEPEALWFPEVKALGFQWHPEMMPESSDAHKFVIRCMNEYLHLDTPF